MSTVYGPPAPTATYGGVTTTPALASAANANADQIYKQDSAKENAYIDSLKANTQGQLDLMLKKLDTDHQLALGNSDTATAQFLESVANSLESQIGRIPYDYQKYSSRELQSYALGNTAIAQNKQNALDKLTNDEKTLAATQGTSNENLTESLNKRGVISGQTVTGGTNQSPTGDPVSQPLTGLSGLGGNQANVQNTNYGDQWGAMGIQKTGIENTFGQQQSNLDFNHTNTMTDLTDSARRGAIDSGNTFTFGKEGANLTYQQQLDALERQRQQLLEQDKQNSYTQAGRTAGIPGF